MPPKAAFEKNNAGCSVGCCLKAMTVISGLLCASCSGKPGDSLSAPAGCSEVGHSAFWKSRLVLTQRNYRKEQGIRRAEEAVKKDYSRASQVYIVKILIH